ncbi:hypothetical protein B0H13DRAFT_1889842 [Mycena leptocephala]|nr:hypothetical protein B0H13DRAFT_1889842 [Mycena leptocephala]
MPFSCDSTSRERTLHDAANFMKARKQFKPLGRNQTNMQPAAIIGSARGCRSLARQRSFTQRQCWDVLELTRMIFEQLESVRLAPNHPPVSKEASLYWLALTCRKFADPAVTLLWERQYGIMPLLKCLPSHKWEISEGSFKIRSPLKVEDWDRVLTYSKCIKQFNDRWLVPEELDPSVLESLVISLPPGSLLFNVRDLSCHSESAVFPYLAFLVGPHITKIYIEHTEPVWRFAALPLLASKCLSLRHVSTNGPWVDESTEWVSSFVTQLTQLRTLDVLAVNEEACRHISGLHHLETFKTLSVSVGESSTTNSFAFLSTIPSYISPRHLTSIALFLQERDYEKVSTNLAMYIMTSDVVRPLLAFPNLRKVELSSPLGFCLDDDFVNEMALAWSEIEHLSIQGGVFIPTIMVSIPLSSCPRLQHLSLTVYASDVEMDHPAGTPRVIQSALTFWDAQRSPITSSVQVADLLSSIFPSLSRICYGSIDRDEWEQVRKLVPIYAAIRAHERRLGQLFPPDSLAFLYDRPSRSFVSSALRGLVQIPELYLIVQTREPLFRPEKASFMGKPTTALTFLRHRKPP